MIQHVELWVPIVWTEGVDASMTDEVGGWETSICGVMSVPTVAGAHHGTDKVADAGHH